MAKVVAVNISEKRGTIKKTVEKIYLTDTGIDGDAHAGEWHRQVSLLDQASVDRMKQKGVEGLVPGIFAENITTEGIELFKLPIGTKIQIGETLLEVTQIGKECHHHCQIYQQIGMCVMPLEGIFAKVLKGGAVKADDEVRVVHDIRIAVLTISDKGSQGIREDKSGPALVDALAEFANIVSVDILPDELEQIKSKLTSYADEEKIDIVFTTGGTGFSPRDVTPEATKAVIDRLTPGIPEAMRQASKQITDRAMLSRATAGIRKSTLIINLPGSPKAALECLGVFLPVMNHAVDTLRGDTYECGRR